MKGTLNTLLLLFLALTLSRAGDYETLTRDFIKGKVPLQSISVMTFSPEGILFLGDSRLGKVFALDLEDRQVNDSREAFELEDIESKLGALLGTDARGVIIHDLAVNPVSQNIYLAVSRADARRVGFWKLPNDIAEATILLRIRPSGEFVEVDLSMIRFSMAEVPRVVEAGTENWRESDRRTEAITDLAYDNGKLFIAGLSNEEFSSSLRVLDFPFNNNSSFSTIEVWHVAHGKFETEAPIRTLLPYDIQGEKYILASYTCTPFVSIPVAEIQGSQHLKSKTLGEFGYGNMPIDIISYVSQRNNREYLLMSNSSKALIRIDPEDIANQKEGLTQPLGDKEYAVGLPHDVLSEVGVTQIDNYNQDHILVLQRMPNGFLNLHTFPTKWM